MMHTIRRIDPLSTAKVAAIAYGIMGLLFVPLILFFSSVAPTDPAMPSIGMGFALAVPLLYMAAGFIFTLLGAALYNLVAGWVGGIQIELSS